MTLWSCYLLVLCGGEASHVADHGLICCKCCCVVTCLRVVRVALCIAQAWQVTDFPSLNVEAIILQRENRQPKTLLALCGNIGSALCCNWGVRCHRCLWQFFLSVWPTNGSLYLLNLSTSTVWPSLFLVWQSEPQRALFILSGRDSMWWTCGLIGQTHPTKSNWKTKEPTFQM